jgi:hypothetical protein
MIGVPMLELQAADQPSGGDEHHVAQRLTSKVMSLSSHLGNWRRRTR